MSTGEDHDRDVIRVRKRRRKLGSKLKSQAKALVFEVYVW